MKVKVVNKLNATTKMKTTVPNSGGKVSNSAVGGTSNKAKEKQDAIKLVEKELEEVSKQLKDITGGKKDAKTIALKAGGVSELKLWEQKLKLMLKLKQWTNLTEEGYKILGKKGPNVTIYKCILVGLCRLGKFDDVVELLDQWKRTAPKCLQMLETKQKMEGYLTAIRSGVDVNKLLLNIEEVIKVSESGAQSSSYSSGSTVPEPNWRYRSPPQRHITFSLCPRILSGVACIYGNECLSAHSKEELKEWQQRILWKNNKTGINDISSIPSSSSSTIPLQKFSIPKELIPLSYRVLPPACMYYLAGLAKKVQDTKNLKDLLVDSLPEVKIKLSTANSIVKRLGGSRPVVNIHKWSCMIASKRPLATVSLLHDQTRDRFAITGAFYFNSKKATLDLVDLHPNNKSQKGIQVLNTFIRPELFLPFNNGWPDWACYQIDVIFQTGDQTPGKFEQDIIFDFKNDPKIAKRISVTLEPPIIQPKIEPVAVANKSSWTDEVNKPIISISSSSSEDALERDFRDTVLLNIPPPPPNNISNIQPNNNLEKSNNNQPDSSIESGSLSQSLSDCEDNLEDDFRCGSNSNLNMKPALSNGQGGGGKDSSSCEQQLQSSQSNSSSLEVITKSTPDKSRFEEVDSVAGLLVRQWVNGTEACYNQLIEDLEDEQLTKDNYISWMNRFIICEIKAREQELLKLSVKSEINIFSAANVGLNASLSVGLFGKLALSKNMNEDSKIGRLVFNNCRTVSIGEVEGSIISKPRTYVCRVINKTEQSIVILIGRKAVEELKLSPGTTRKLDIWLHLDHAYLDVLKVALQGVTDYHLKLLFPNFPENQPWDFNSLVNNSLSRHEVDDTLNSKQRDAVHAILSENVTDNFLSRTPVAVLISGPPSSGKSHLLARSIMSIFNSQKLSQFQSLSRILICTYTNKAADEFITEYFTSWLSQSNRSEPFLLRIYHADQMSLNTNATVKKHCLLVNDESSFRYPTLDELLSYKIVIVTVSTCLELLQLGLPDYIFSHVFIDECHRMIEAESICPLLLAGKDTRIVVTGDMKLLNPETFTLPTMNSKCKEVTLVDRLSNLYPERHPFRIRLDEMYNINQDIVQFVSQEFYSSSVKCAKSPADHPKYHPLTFSIVQGGEDCQPDHGEGYYNMKEIHEVRDRLTEVIQAWPSSWGSYKEHSICVITPYSDQALSLRIQLKLGGLGFVDVEALSNVLSKQYRVVIISPVRTFQNEDPDNLKLVRESDAGGGFFTNPKAIYTALTRAKNLTIVVGDLVGLCNIGVCKDIWRQFVSVCRKNNSLLGLPGNFESRNNSSSGHFGGSLQEIQKNSAIVSPISRPTAVSIPSQILKKSDLFSSSPNLDTTRHSDLSPKSPPGSDDKSGSLQKLRNLSSIWNTPDPPMLSARQTPPPPFGTASSSSNNNEQFKTPVLSFSNIWGDTPTSSTGSLGNLADPSSIWGASSSSLSHPPPPGMERVVHRNTTSSSQITTTTPTSSSSNNFPKAVAMPNPQFSSFDDNSSYKSPFDLPDVRLMAEAALASTSINNPYNPTIATISPFSQKPPPPVVSSTPFSNMMYTTSTNPTLTTNPLNISPCWSTPSPDLSHNIAIPNNIFSTHHHAAVMNMSSQPPPPNIIASQSQEQQQPFFRTCTSFEIAQANYAYYHGQPRRLGFNPPPRMLRNYRPLDQLTQYGNNGISECDNFNNAATGFVKDSPKNFDFFKEMELNSVAIDDRKEEGGGGSSSSASSSSSHDQDNSLEVGGDSGSNTRKKKSKKFMLNSLEFPDLTKPSNTVVPPPTGAGWIEVRSTKKGKKEPHPPGTGSKKGKKKSSSTTTISMSTFPFGNNNKAGDDTNKVMTVTEMIESLKEMGFEKRQAIKALSTCNRDLERAVEWLILYASGTQKKE